MGGAAECSVEATAEHAADFFGAQGSRWSMFLDSRSRDASDPAGRAHCGGVPEAESLSRRVTAVEKDQRAIHIKWRKVSNG